MKRFLTSLWIFYLGGSLTIFYNSFAFNDWRWWAVILPVSIFYVIGNVKSESPSNSKV